VEPSLDETTRAVFAHALRALRQANAEFLVGGAFALNHYTGIWRNTKDLDVFCEPAQSQRVLDILAAAGFQTRVTEAHWLGKAQLEDVLVDVIWGSGNWSTFVDDHWFRHAERGRIAGEEVDLAPAEDVILSKAWVAGRERYDGADIVHLIHARGARFDWDDVVARFGAHWELLLHYLLLYRFVYPADRDVVSARLIQDLAARIGTDQELADGLSFRGPLVDRYAYLHDLRYDGLSDPREVLARRAQLPVEAVRYRRGLDTLAFDRGTPYQHRDADAEASTPADAD
jgi:hypothetical protein